jgi:putative nucleotidyltransferase with HDIG domain
VIKSGQPQVVPDTSQDPRHYKGIDRLLGKETRTLVAVPLRTNEIVLGDERGTTKKRIIGGIEAINKESGFFTPGDAELLSTLAKQAATTLQIAQLYTNADELFLDTIKVLVAAIDAKDPYTEGHSQRVSDISVAIAEELNLSAEERHHIRIGSLLHDIGKIGIPDNILAKPDRLTPSEFDEIKKHPTIGANIIAKIHLLKNELPALSQHHERIDGSGYPKGLKGDEISLIARIVAVADVFDALTSDRPYRPALDIETSLDILRAEAGDHLDAHFVEGFIKAYTRDKILKRKTSPK